jgi:hypothetical protein
VNGSGAAGRVLVCVMTPAWRRGRPLIEPARLRPHSSMPPLRGEPMTGTRTSGCPGQRLLAMELPLPSTFHLKEAQQLRQPPLSASILRQPLTAPRSFVLAGCGRSTIDPVRGLTAARL